MSHAPLWNESCPSLEGVMPLSGGICQWPVSNYISIRSADAPDALPLQSLHTQAIVEWDHESDLTLPGLWHANGGQIFIPHMLPFRFCTLGCCFGVLCFGVDGKEWASLYGKGTCN